MVSLHHCCQHMSFDVFVFKEISKACWLGVYTVFVRWVGRYVHTTWVSYFLWRCVCVQPKVNIKAREKLHYAGYSLVRCAKVMWAPFWCLAVFLWLSWFYLKLLPTVVCVRRMEGIQLLCPHYTHYMKQIWFMSGSSPSCLMRFMTKRGDWQVVCNSICAVKPKQHKDKQSPNESVSLAMKALLIIYVPHTHTVTLVGCCVKAVLCSVRSNSERRSQETHVEVESSQQTLWSGWLLCCTLCCCKKGTK